MKTTLRKEIEQEKWSKLLLSDASTYQMFKQFYKNNKHECHIFICAVASGVIGFILGGL